MTSGGVCISQPIRPRLKRKPSTKACVHQSTKACIDTAGTKAYSQSVKNHNSPKKVATPQDIVSLAKKSQWKDMEMPSGEVVTADTIREMFTYAAAGFKRSKRRKRPHAAAA